MTETDTVRLHLSSEDFVCSICHDVFYEPVSAPCGHCFCRNCLQQWLETTRVTVPSCPKCRSVFPFGFDASYMRLMRPDMLLTEVVRQHCYNDCPEGCGERVHPSRLEQHELTCDNASVCCPNTRNGCTAVVTRKRERTHLSDCAFFCCQASELGCEYKGAPADLIGHEKVCVLRQVKSYVDAAIAGHATGIAHTGPSSTAPAGPQRSRFAPIHRHLVPAPDAILSLSGDHLQGLSDIAAALNQREARR